MPRIFVPWRDHPMRLVVAVVVGVLSLQAVAALIIAWTSGSTASNVAVDTAILAGDATALHVRERSDTAANGLVEVARLAQVEGLDPADPDALVPAMVRTLRAATTVSGLGLASTDGAAVVVRRTPTGIDAVIRTADGQGEIRRFGLDGSDLGITVEVSEAGARRMPQWIAQGAAAQQLTWHEPYVSLRTARIAVDATVSGRADFGEFVAVAFTETPDLDRSLWASPGASLGQAWIVTSAGQVLAAPSERAPELRAAVREDQRIPTATDMGVALPTGGDVVDSGTIDISGGVVVYERPVSGPEGGSGAPDWSVVVEMRTDEVASGAPLIRRTLVVYAVVIVAVVVTSFMALWRLRGPLNEVLRRSQSDALTGLANRHEFGARGQAILDAARSVRGRVVVVMIDIDLFKRVNDTLGHHAGDELLVGFARALESVSAPRDLVARLGGDEFAVLRWLGADEDPGEAAERLRAAASTALETYHGAALGATASAGYAVAGDGEYRLTWLVERADAAMVEGRPRGKGATYSA